MSDYTKECLSPYEEYLFQTLRRINNRTKATVKTVSLSVATGTPERTVRRYLSILEVKGFAHRPSGPKSGWAPLLAIAQVTSDIA